MELKFKAKEANKNYKVTKIKMAENQPFKQNDTLFQVENGKVNMPVKAEYNGVIKKILIKEGDMIKNETAYAEAECEEAAPKETDKSQSGGFSLFGKKEEILCDIAIIGAGPGGYEAAIYAAQNGKNVVLIEKDKVGGTCLNAGCIPTKAIVNSAEKFHTLKNLSEIGVTCEQPGYERAKIIEHKNKVVESLRNGIQSLLESNHVRYIKGTACFSSEKEIEVAQGLNKYLIKAENIIIATGSKINPLPIKGMEAKEVWNSTDALEWKEDFNSITIVGGGVIGMEFAGIYASFGKKVTVVEYAERILPMIDSDLSDALLEELQGVAAYVKAKVKEIRFSEENKAIVMFEQDGKEKCVVSDKVLVATGRRGNIDGLHLERTTIEFNERTDTIPVDDTMRTNVPGIYAIGDVTGKIQLAHVASHQGFVAVDQILGKEHKMDYKFIPSVIFSTMEIATIGKSEEELKKSKTDYKVSKFPYAANGKALSMEEAKGFVKLIYNKETEQIEGAAIIGADASNLISSLSVALSNHLTYEDLIHTVFPHPTLGEMIHEASLGLSTGAIHYHE